MILQRAIKTLNILNLLSFLYIVASAIYYTKYQQIGFYVFFISYLFEFLLEKKWRNYKVTKKNIYFILVLTYFLLAIIYHPFEHSDKYFNRLLELRLGLLAFSVPAYFGLNKYYKVRYICAAFILSTLGAIGYLIWGVHDFYQDTNLLSIVSAFRTEHINTHIIFNAYSNIAIICCWFLVFRTKTKYNTTKNILCFLSAASMITTIITLEGRMGVITLCVILSCLLVCELHKINKILLIAFLILTSAIFLKIISTHKRLDAQNLETEPRITFIWEAAINVMEKQPVIGYGASRAQEEFDKELIKKEPADFREYWKDIKIMHSHNHYFQTYMEFGILGEIILFGLIIFPVILADKKRKIFIGLIMLVFAAQSLTDIVFTLQGFPVIFCVCAIMALTVEYEEKNICMKSANDNG